MTISPGRRAAAPCVISCLAALVTITIGCGEPTIVPPKTPTLRIAVGAPGGDFFNMGEALANTLRTQTPSYAIEIVTNSAGAISSLESLQQGASDCGFSYANVAYEAFAGRLPGAPGAAAHLRGVALIQVSPLYFIVGRDSSITDVRHLRGRRLAIGARGGASPRAATLVLEASGVDISSVHILPEGFGTSVPQLREGTIDAVFVLGGQPSSFVSRAVASEARVLPLQGPEIDALRERYPFLHPSLIPAHTYQGQTAPIRTVGIDSLLLCRDDMSADGVQRVTRDWFLTFDRLVKDEQLSDGVSPSMASATPIPLHRGASDYYRARQVLHR